MEFLSYLITGISLGSIYAIIALGYTMVYGIAKMLNFAHGDVIMVGAYVSFYVTMFAGSNLLGEDPSALTPALWLWCPCCWLWWSARFWAWSSRGWLTAPCARPAAWRC